MQTPAYDTNVTMGVNFCKFINVFPLQPYWESGILEMPLSIRVNSLVTIISYIGQGNNTKPSCDVFNTILLNSTHFLFSKSNSCLAGHVFLNKGIAMCNRNFLCTIDQSPEC